VSLRENVGKKEKGPDPKIGAASRNIAQVLAGRGMKNTCDRENVGAPTFLD
jgi:hypothetical protein